jgi:predicted HicB family RNase H-like nuclease
MKVEKIYSKEDILARLEKVDFDALTPEEGKESTLMMKVDKEVHETFKAIANRRGMSIKAMGNKCVLNFLRRCKQDLEEGY